MKVVRVDDLSKLPVDYVDADGTRVIGLEFAGGAAGMASQLSARITRPHLLRCAARRYASSTTARRQHRRDRRSARGPRPRRSATTVPALSLFVDAGNADFTNSLDGNGQATGFAGRITVNPLVIADSRILVQHVTGAALGDCDPRRLPARSAQHHAVQRAGPVRRRPSPAQRHGQRPRLADDEHPGRRGCERDLPPRSRRLTTLEAIDQRMSRGIRRRRRRGDGAAHGTAGGLRRQCPGDLDRAGTARHPDGDLRQTMTVINRSMYPLQQGFSSITSMQARLDQLQVQLGTGKRFADSRRATATSGRSSLQVRERLSRIEGYTQNAGTVNLRLDMLDTVMSAARQDRDRSTRARRSPAATAPTTSTSPTCPSCRKGRLDEVVTLLNSQRRGPLSLRRQRHGPAAGRQPVERCSTARAAGPASSRSSTSASSPMPAPTASAASISAAIGAGVTLAEDGTHPFGLKLSTLSTTSAGIALTQPAGAPAVVIDQRRRDPSPTDETITVGLTLPDGTSTAITLKAVTGTPRRRGEFQIGADRRSTLRPTSRRRCRPRSSAVGDDRARRVLDLRGGRELLQRAGRDGAARRRPALRHSDQRSSRRPRPTPCSGIAAATARRRATASPPRSTTARSSSYGIQANEDGFVDTGAQPRRDVGRDLSVVRSDVARRASMPSRSMQSARLSEQHNSEPGSIELITLELGQARDAIGNAKDRHTAYKAQLDTMLAESRRWASRRSRWSSSR